MEKVFAVLKARANPVLVNKITLDALDELEILLKVNKQIFLDFTEANKWKFNAKTYPNCLPCSLKVTKVTRS